MPRIDPQQLLSCLGVLLNPEGGIRSQDEVARLASLMTKYSKNLVSKCVYILILKKTDTDLLGRFMTAGGWNLTHLWLTNGIINKNWALVAELLELMLMCPVDVERLKANNCPKLVKGLSKEGGPEGVRILASKLVEQWLKVVKGETQGHPSTTQTSFTEQAPDNKMVQATDVTAAGPEASVPQSTETHSESEVKKEVSSQATPVFRISVRDGKQEIAKVDSGSPKRESEEVILPDIIKDDSKSKEKSKHSSSRHSSSSHKSSSSSSKRSSSSSSSHSSHRSKSSSRDKDRDRKHSSSSSKDKERSKHKENGVKSDTKESKEKQAERDKATLAKLIPQSISKLGKIPKKSDSKDSKSDSKDSKSDKKPVAPAPKIEVKKPSISIEDRKNSENRPKTVKIFNGRMRSTGLEEEAKPPPPRGVAGRKVGGAVTTPTLPTKRPSPPRDILKDLSLSHPPEKRPKIADLVVGNSEVEQQSRPGGIKLIAPKPKPIGLQECGLFMDAMVAASTKKEPKKRKRRISSSKDDGPPPPKTNSPPSSPVPEPTSPKKAEPTSPHVLRPTAPKFYKDTLESDDDSQEDDKPLKELKREIAETNNPEIKPEEKSEASPELDTKEEVENALKSEHKIPGGVLMYHKRKGPKKSVKWRSEEELEQIKYFELDETERVNVTKTFSDMKQLDMSGEREALQMTRKLPNEDLMDERTRYRPLIPIDLTPDLAVRGNKSKEKDIQYAREKVILQALYFHRSLIPDSPSEPDIEHHPMEDPVVIPLDDVAGNPDNIKDFTSTPFPDAKTELPRIPVPVPMPVPPFVAANPNFMSLPNNPQFGPNGPPFGPNGPPFGPSGPGFMNGDIPPIMGGGDWRGPDGRMLNGMPPNDMPMGPPFPMGGPIPPNMFPPDGFNMGGPPFPMEFGPNGPMFDGPPNFRGGPRGGGAMLRGRGGRGGFDRFNNGPPNNWKGGGGGGGNNNRNWNNRGTICKHFEKSGYCRQGENCQFLHPGVNCPPF